MASLYGELWTRRGARLLLGAAALLLSLTWGAAAAGKCSPAEQIRVYPRAGQTGVPRDVQLVWVYGHRSPAHLKQLLAGLPTLSDDRGASVPLQLVRQQPWKTNLRGHLTFTALILRPKRLLRANAEYVLAWPAGARIAWPLGTWRFTTGASKARAIAAAPVVQQAVFWLNASGCGAHRYFKLTVSGAGQTGLYQLRLARTRAQLAAPAGKARLLAEILDSTLPGQIIVGSGQCGGTYRFRLRQRVFGQLRFIGAAGAASPWSAPFELVADPARPGTQRTCPPHARLTGPPPSGPVLAKMRLKQAVNAYVAGKYLLSVRRGREVLRLAPRHEKAIQIVGASACYLRDRRTAQRAYDHVAPSYRGLLLKICLNNGIQLVRGGGAGGGPASGGASGPTGPPSR